MKRRPLSARPVAGLLCLVALSLSVLLPAVSAEPVTCDGVTSESKASNESSNVCDCKEGWVGPSCNICTDNAACRAIPGAMKSNECNRNTFTPVKELHGICTVASDDIERLIHGQGMINLRATSQGNFSFDFIKVHTDNGKWVPLFACVSAKTRLESDPGKGQIRYVSPDLACNLTCTIGSDRTCTPFLDNIIKSVGNKGGSIVTCEPKKGACQISESTLDTFLGGVSTTGCKVSECVEAGMTGSAAVVDFTVISRMSSPQKASIALGSVYVCLAGLLAMVAGAFWVASRGFGSYASAKASCVAAAAAAGGKGGAAAEEKPPKTYSVVWEGLTYQIGDKKILKGITGLAMPGELLAIMGPSGSGKTSLIDILARKHKMGHVGGRLCYNGVEDEDEEVRERIGFVDQEDNLMGTMTVFESVMLSAVLRLPDDMPLAAKGARVMRVLKDLRLTHVADSYIGNKSKRGISGGEKRRVMVAMELVKVPSVLLLDEPTSGLDAFNANLLVQCLKDLAAKKGTTIMMTIHQPRSNIFLSFDRLLVLNQGEITYHGLTKEVGSYFDVIGRPIPAVYNPADYLIDVLFEKEVGGLLSSSSSLVLTTEAAEQKREGGGREEDMEETKDPVVMAGVREVEMVGTTAAAAAAARGSGKATATPPRKGAVTAGQRSSSSPAFSPIDLQGSPARQAVERAEMGAQQQQDDNNQQQAEELHLSGSGKSSGGHEPIEGNPLAIKYKESAQATAVHEEVKAVLRKHHLDALDESGESGGSGGGGDVDMSGGSSVASRPLTEGVAASSSSSSFSSARAAAAGSSPSPSSDADNHHASSSSALGGDRKGAYNKTKSASSSGSATTSTSSRGKARAMLGGVTLAGLVTGALAKARRFYVEVGMLSKRTILGLVRNPLLLASHVSAAVYFAGVLGIVYWQLDMSSLGAIQNRLGAFLLSCVFLTFTSVSALPLFWLERSLYIHEYSNRFYSPAAYFITKVFFDLVLLRCLPTLLFGAITYGMIGYRPGMAHFVAYEALLVLLICTSSMLNLIIGMVTKDIMSGILVAVVTMIHFLMLTNLFINFGSMRLVWLKWLRDVSFINFAYEGLAQNELVGRKLLNFPISTGTGVLAELGFRTDSFYQDLTSLLIYLTVAIAIAYITLRVAVKENR